MKLHVLSIICLVAFPLVASPVGARAQVRMGEAAAVTFTSSNLPIVVIDTHGQEILDEPKISADMGVIDNGEGVRNNVTDPFNAYDGPIGIEIRGSSSQMFPKKQYGFETRDSIGNNFNVPLLGLPGESDWVLSAQYNDKSLMRDALVFSLANATGHYASRARYCELVLNGQYAGVYILFEKVKRNKNRVNITKMTSTDTTGDAVTGGYLIKIDKIEGTETEGWFSQYLPYPGSAHRIYYQFEYPKSADLTMSQRVYIVNYIKAFESMMEGSGYADTLTGYPAMIDVSAFVDIVLLGELSKNVDDYRLSLFLSKDRDSKGGKLTPGPAWDYNLGFGNCDYYDASLIAGLNILYLTTNSSFMMYDDYQVPFWWKKLFVDPAFQARLKQRWHELRAGPFSTALVHAYIDSVAALLDEAQVRNFTQWPVLGTYVWPNAYIGATYAAEIAYLKQWISDRARWLDAQFVIEGVGGAPGNIPATFALFQNFPNPFNPETVISFQCPVASDVKVIVYDILGREVAVLVNESKAPGRYRLPFDGSALASGVYVYRLSAGPFVESRKMVVLK